MALPTYQTSMLPLLRFADDRKEHTLREATNAVSSAFDLSDDERNQLLKSGRKPVINDRVGWARTYLGQALLLESTRRGYFRITDRGLALLETNPSTIDDKTLRRYPEFVEFLKRKTLKKKSNVEIGSQEITGFDVPLTESQSTPEEALEDSFQTIRKRWEATVGRPELQAFAGALLGKQANKGVFITTSNFSSGAKEFVKSITSNIILIDGDELADLMIDYNVGVSVVANYEIKKIDSDYFIDE